MKKHYQRFCNKASCLILTTLFATVFFSNSSVAQETNSLTISEDLRQHMKEKYVRMYAVIQDEIIETKRPVLFLNKEVSDANEFLGTYTKTSNEYLKATGDDKNGRFIENELVDNSKGYGTWNLSETVYSIYKKNDTGMLYAFADYDVKIINEFTQTQELLEIVHKLGYKEYRSNDSYDKNLYIKSKTSEIKLDVRTYQELKANPNYISQLDNDQMKLSTLVKQSVSHSKTLDKYLSIYNIKRSRMLSADLTAWKNATKQADVLNKQIVKLNEKYEGNYSVMPIDKSYHTTLSNFADNLLASKGVLGI